MLSYSCLQATPGRLSCVFNVIEIPEGDGRCYGRSGVCTGWIDRLTRGIQGGEKQEEDLTEGMGELTLNEPVKVCYIFFPFGIVNSDSYLLIKNSHLEGPLFQNYSFIKMIH